MYKSLEEDIIRFIQPHKAFPDTINQHEITKKCNDERELWGLKPVESRRVRRVIEKLIEKGYPIISTPHYPGGYNWEGGPGEALKCYKRLRRKAAKEFKKARHVLNNMFKGQLRLWDMKEKIRNS